MGLAWRAAREAINKNWYGQSKYYMIPDKIIKAHRKGADIEMEVVYGEADCRGRGFGFTEINDRNCKDIRRGADRALYRVIVDRNQWGSEIHAWPIRRF